MRVRRAQARLCGRDARLPGTQTYPCKPFMGEGEDDARKRGFAGETPALPGSQTYPCKPVKGEGIRQLPFILDFRQRAWLPTSGFPLARE